MDAEVFGVSTSPMGDGPLYAWRTHRTPSMARSFAGIAIPAALGWLLTLAGLPGSLAILIFVFAWMVAYLVPSGEYIEFDFASACIILPGRICVPFRTIERIRLEFLPMDLLHDWTNLSLHFTTHEREFRLDLLGQEMAPIESFLQRIRSVANPVFVKQRMDLDRGPGFVVASPQPADCPPR